MGLGLGHLEELDERQSVGGGQQHLVRVRVRVRV